MVDWLAAAAGLGLGITIALAIGAESAGSLSAPGGVATALGRLAGLLAAYAMIVVVLLVARIPPLERAIGQDRLVSWHRRLGPWPLYLLLAHAVLITVGYAAEARTGVLHELGQLIWTYPGILAAAVATVLLFAAGITSYRLARRRMAYETWWSVHLYTYLALFLSFSHQIDTGAAFVGHPAGPRLVDGAVAGDARRGRRGPHRSAAVAVAAPPGAGRRRHARRVRGSCRSCCAGAGWTGCRWPAASSSSGASCAAGCGGRRTRTRSRRRRRATSCGSRSRTWATTAAGSPRVAPGTRVAIEGPYGTFTADTAGDDRLLLVGAGVGTAPVLALLQELPPESDVTVLLRASTREELVLRDEVAAEVRRRGGRLIERVGPRGQVRLDAAALRAARARRRAAARSTCAAPTRSRTAWPPSCSAPACRATASTSSPSPSDMRRFPIVLTATVAGTAGVLAFHPHSPAVQTPRRRPPRRRRAPPRRRRPPRRLAAPAAPRARRGTATGDAVDTRYGPAQVKVTVKDGKITAVEAVELQADDPRSQMISNYAAPILQQEVLSSQTADVDTVSGATYTSASYLQSVQSALDKLGYKAPDGSVATAQVPS